MDARGGVGTAVVIPAYGHVDVTHACVRDCQREAGLVDVVVVDNAGDYVSLGNEVVLRPGRNLGWLRGTNLGLEWAASRDYTYLVGLNNDTRLSNGFFRGLVDAAEATGGNAVVLPSYDDVASTLRVDHEGSARDYRPEATEVEVRRIDGTCLLLPTALYRAVGPLDEKNFGRRGWGAVEDYSIRVRNAGSSLFVTRRAFLNHARGTTARSISGDYARDARYAAIEMRRGMRRKWGVDWRSQFEEGQFRPDEGWRDILCHYEDVLGLRRAQRSGAS